MTGASSYRVIWTVNALAALKSIRDTFRESGKLINLGPILRAMDERLRTDPVGFGEIYRSANAIEEHLAVVRPLAIDFAVDKARKVVLVRKSHALALD